MSRLTDVLDQGAEAARVTCGVWHAVVWHEPGSDLAAWRYEVYQPQTTDEELAPVDHMTALVLEDLVASLTRYPYFITPDMPWAPAKAPAARERTGW
jgi:hypothetical protein